MAVVKVTQSTGFNSNNFWIQNSGASTNETFETPTGSESTLIPPTRTDHYAEFTFDSGGLKYNYVGDWTTFAATNVIADTVSASGTYDSVVVESGGSEAATVTGLDFDVDFGTHTGIFLLDLVGGVLDTVTDILFGPDAPSNEAFENLHKGATPNIAKLAFAGDDSMTGNVGNDTLAAYSGDDVLIGRAGNDRLLGGSGKDQLSGGNGSDQLVGGGGRDELTGGGGNDKIIGGGGNDMLTGSLGADRLLGGDGNDTFRFGKIAESTLSDSDLILDFEDGSDRIDLSGIDADLSTAGNGAFTLIGSAQFSGTAGELRVAHTTAKTVVTGDVDGDGSADFRIIVNDLVGLGAGDFIL